MAWVDFIDLADEGRFFPMRHFRADDINADPENENSCRHALAFYLLNGIKDPCGKLPARHLPDINFSDSIIWTEAPLLVQKEQEAKIYYVLLGLLPMQEIRIEKGWLTDRAEAAARKALMQVCKNNGFVLLRRARAHPAKIDGDSLGAALAIAGLRLMEGRQFPSGVAITGALAENGDIQQVNYVLKKYEAAIAGKLLFMHPFANREPALAAKPVDMHFPLFSLCGAKAVCDALEAQDSPKNLSVLLGQWREDPAAFFAWLNRHEHSDALLNAVIAIAKAEDWSEKFDRSPSLARAVRDFSDWRDRNRNSAMIPGLLDLFRAKHMRRLDPLLQLRLSRMNATRLNHLGICKSSWHTLCEKCIPMVAHKNLEGFMEALRSAVPAIINSRINAYDFHMQVPAKWLEMLELHENHCKRCGFEHDNTLGTIYGCLTHLSAMRGELAKAKELAEKSIQFFKSREDRRRRWIDLAHIFCELNDAKKAAEFLLLACGQKKTLLPNLDDDNQDRWFHQAFSRLCLIDKKYSLNYPVEKILEKLLAGKDGKCFPWNIWANNFGRLLFPINPALSRKCLELSVEICLQDDSCATLIPMALLPLAALMRFDWKHKYRKQAMEALASLQKKCGPTGLNEKHFAAILQEKNPEAALEIVEKDQARLFPLFYR